MNILRKVTKLGISIGIGCCAVAATVYAQPGQGLFEAVTSTVPQTRDVVDEDSVIARSRYVSIVAGQLGDAADGLQGEGKKLRLNFFSDVDYSVAISREERRSDADYTLFGDIEGVGLGHCALVVQDGHVTGNCSSPEGMYQIRHTADGVHVLREIDQSKFAPEMEPIEVSNTGDPEIETAPDPDPLKDEGMVHEDGAVTDDDGSIVEMLVVYTPAARAAAGGTTNMLADIRLAIDETNQAYINSGITHRVQLAAAREISYTESGVLCNASNSDLTRLIGTSDGYMDIVHSWRNSYRADQVTLITDTGDACGCAAFMSTVSTSFAPNAFSVVKDSCSTGYYSFGHELGHNMSAHHDCYVHTGTSPYAYIHGYVNTTDRWRTVMAYNTQCADSGFNCTRIQYFSNPTKTYGGDPMGTTTGACQADNARTHRNTDLTVSRFRDGICSITGSVERVLQYDDSVSTSNYVYVRPSATASYYQYFRTADDNMATSATRAMRKKVDVSVRGDQSCFDNAYDFGGTLDYMIVQP